MLKRWLYLLFSGSACLSQRRVTGRDASHLNEQRVFGLARVTLRIRFLFYASIFDRAETAGTGETMTDAIRMIRRVATTFGLFGVAAAFGGGTGCVQQPSCDNISRVETPATFELACSPSDLTAVNVSGPCSSSNMGSDPTDHYGNDEVGRGKLEVGSQVAGLCHVDLTFASGFVYSTDVTFTGTSDSCGTGFISPTQSVFAVNNPDSTCADGGSAAGAGG
jgi:hypothetical protein